jgi:hypothetical protein
MKNMPLCGRIFFIHESRPDPPKREFKYKPMTTQGCAFFRDMDGGIRPITTKKMCVRFLTCPCHHIVWWISHDEFLVRGLSSPCESLVVSISLCFTVARDGRGIPRHDANRQQRTLSRTSGDGVQCVGTSRVRKFHFVLCKSSGASETCTGAVAHSPDSHRISSPRS